MPNEKPPEGGLVMDVENSYSVGAALSDAYMRES